MEDDAPDGDALRGLLVEVERLRSVEERLRAENEHLLETQRALEDNRDHYSDLFDQAPVAWMTLDAEGSVQNLNLVAVTLLGFGRRFLIGSMLAALVSAEDRRRLLDHLAECRKTNELLVCEVRFTHREGGPVPVRLSTRATHGPDGGFTLSLLDLREREATDAEHKRLIKAEREARAANDAKDQFIAMLSHELRTPLTPVLAATSALVEDNGVPSELRDTLAVVQRNVMMEVQLIDDLLDVARIAHGKLRIEKSSVDLHKTVLEAANTLGADFDAKGLRLTTDFAAQHYWVNGDRTRLQQVFWNLLRNAIKCTERGGQVAVRSWNSDDSLLVEVSDTGRGIEPETLPRLFEPFEQSREENVPGARGLGLGLPICRGILEQHDATIVASSQGRGKGARFVVEIANVERPTLVPAKPISTPPSPGRATRILLVEDHEDTADIFERLLRRGGYEVKVANSLQAALAVSRDEFDVLLSDVGLTDGSGLELMRTLRKTGRVKGIALSGYGTEEDVRASKEAGFSAHITKPVNFVILLEAIATLGG